jgi:hypothetical protein
MKAGENIKYLMLLENTIKSQKKNNGYYPTEINYFYRIDIITLLNHTMKKYPELINTTVDIDPHKLPLVTKSNLVEYLKQSRKGAVCYYRDENGKRRIMVNAGPGYGLRKNRVLFFNEDLNKESPENFKRILYREMIKNDIEFVYRNLRKKQQQSRNEIFPVKKSIDKASSSFERVFKAYIKEQGSGVNVMKTAQSMVMKMPEKERAELNSALKKMNIKNGAELEMVLVQWKHEALSQSLSTEKKQSREITPSRA